MVYIHGIHICMHTIVECRVITSVYVFSSILYIRYLMDTNILTITILNKLKTL